MTSNIEAALAAATQDTERTLLRLLQKEADLRHELSETRREIGLALSAHRRAYPAVGTREIAALSEQNRTTLWEIEVGRVWRKDTPANLVRVGQVISLLRDEMRESGEAASPEALVGAA